MTNHLPINQRNNQLVLKLFRYQNFLLHSEQYYRSINDKLVTQIKSIIFNPTIAKLRNRYLTSKDEIIKEILADDIMSNVENLIPYDYDSEEETSLDQIFSLFDNLFNSTTYRKDSTKQIPINKFYSERK